MLDSIRGSIQGFVKIIDKETKEVLVDTHNDVLYGNISSALAHALIGNPESFLFYIAFGNGGAYVGPTGTILYKPSIGGASSLVKNPTANLYNTIYVKKMSNDSTSSNYDETAKAYIPAEQYASNYEDIIVDVTLGYSDLPIKQPDTPDTNVIMQSEIDNSTFVGTSVSTIDVTTADQNQLVFNEIGLFAGSSNLFPTSATQTVDEVFSFVNQGVNYSRTPGTKSKLMLTHVVFHPIQKSANRSLEIIYTLRIQIGAN